MELSTLMHLAKIDSRLQTGEVADALGITPADVRRLAMLSDGLQPVPDPSRRTRQYRAVDVLAWRNAHPHYERTDR